MTLTLRAVFSKIFIDYLNAGIVRASAFVDNEASIRVQEKCGLKKLRGVDGEEKRFWHEVSEGRGGGRRQEVVLEWRRDRDVK
jgi:RimJ/RimL family protein N-acetyltransferase